MVSSEASPEGDQYLREAGSYDMEWPRRHHIAPSLTNSHSPLCRPSSQRPKRATSSQLTRFHTDDYVDFLEAVTPETVNQLTGHGSRYLVGDDCPSFEGLFEFCSISAGGSIAAAERLNHGAADIAINWAGGLHHAKKREASGFCYVNGASYPLASCSKATSEY